MTALAPRDNLATCDRDPIHIPSAIQPHGFLVAAGSDTGCITHISENAPLAPRVADCLGTSLAERLALQPAAQALLEKLIADPLRAERPVALQTSWTPSAPTTAPTSYFLTAHLRNGSIIVEGELPPADEMIDVEEANQAAALFLARLTDASSLPDLCHAATEETRRITGFDRVLIYQFDEEWNGSVVAESRNDLLPAYLGHHFPASDIPKPARDLYHINRLRQIASSDYQPVRIRAAATQLPPLDLTQAGLRSVSPVHLEYMRNMGTGASLSASIMLGGRLWGLLSCHCRDPRRLSFRRRSLCDLLGQVLSLQLSSREQARQLIRDVELRGVLARMLPGMSEAEDFTKSLKAEDLLSLTGAHGAAVVRGEHVYAFGRAPADADVLSLAQEVSGHFVDGVYSTDRLGVAVRSASAGEDLLSGLLAISISPTDGIYVLWFRAEFVQTVLWGGNPHKTTEVLPEGLRIHPRKSFESWQQVLRGRSARWETPELDAAGRFRRALIDLVLKRSSERARLTSELQRMNRELESFAYTVSHDLRAPFRHVRGFADLLKSEKTTQLDDEARHYLERIMKAATYAGELVDTLLDFSKMSLTPIEARPIDLGEILQRVRSETEVQLGGRRVEWKIAPLPEIYGDPKLLQLAFQNLIDNAVKYTARQPIARIEVGATRGRTEWIFSVKDNGVGFDPRYADKLFGVFQRLHNSAEFGGMGIGLATVRRIVERHGGRCWAESAPGHGATFYVSLPFAVPHAAPTPSAPHA